MTFYGHFTRVVRPENPGIMFLEDEDGNDFYTFTRGLCQWSDRGDLLSTSTGQMFISVDPETDRIEQFNRDLSALVPNGYDVYGIDPDTTVVLGMLFQNGVVLPALPPPPIVLPPISDRQFFQALASPPFSLITAQEALGAVKTGEIPAVMQTVIDGLPTDQRFATTMLLAGATTFERDNPLVAVFGASQGMDAAAIDAFWSFAAGL